MGRRRACLFLLLIIVEFIEANPRIDVAVLPPDSNNDISEDKKLLKVLNVAPGHSLRNTQNTKFKNSTFTFRSFEVGDTITPEEMLVLAKAFMRQVKNKGKGIISGSLNEFDLADKLFERYFMTLQRMVVVRDIDIDGLDALQALSLNGEVVTLRSETDSYTEAPRTNFKGFKADASMELYGMDPADLPQKCHYKVLKKKMTKLRDTNTNNNRSSVDRRQLANTLKAKLTTFSWRQLVVNPWWNLTLYEIRRRNSEALRHGRRKLGSKKVIKAAKKSIVRPATTSSTTVTPSGISQTNKGDNVTCRWKYNCTTPWKLQSCRLFAFCSNKSDFYDMFTEKDENLRRFREAVGISIIDEEVEKIFEMHYARMNLYRHDDDKQVESLMKYFHDIVEASQGAQTTPMSYNREDRHVHLANVGSSRSERTIKKNEHDRKFLAEDTKLNADDLEARKMLGVIDKNKDDEEAKKLLGVIDKK